MVKEGCFLPLKTRKAPRNQGFCHSYFNEASLRDMKHSLRSHEVFRKRNMKRSACPRSHVAKPRFIAESCFISEASSCAAGALHSKNAPLSVDKSAFFLGGGSGIRTHVGASPNGFQEVYQRIPFQLSSVQFVLKRFAKILILQGFWGLFGTDMN